MRFLNPQLLWLIPFVLLFMSVLAVSAARRRRKALSLLLGPAAGDSVAVKLSGAKRNIRILLLTGSMILLITAAARPSFSSELLAWQPQGRDILVLFDVSRSMLATDVAPSRLEHAKYLLRQLIERESGDRFGIVAFAGHAYLLCPLTSDRVALEEYIRELAPGIVPVGGTNIELALTTAMTAAQGGASGSPGFLLITDGDELSGDAEKAARELAAKEIPLFVAGLGDPATATPVPGEDGSFMRLADGELVTSRLNENKLAELAKLTGGLYIRSTATHTGLAVLERRIDQLGRNEREENGTRTVPVEEFPAFLAAAVILFMLYLLLGERPFARRAAILLPLFLTLGAAEAEAPLSSPAPAEAVPAAPADLYNFALKKQQEGQNGFTPHYEQVIQTGEDELRKRSYHNLAAASQQKGTQGLEKARGELQQQALDGALSALTEAEKEFGTAEELYSRSLASAGQNDAVPSAGNLRKLIVDRKELRELRKKIEELKQQQQQAQQQTGQAQQQNRQNQQNQDQQKQTGDTISQARQSAEELEKKAEELNQEKLRDQAQKAREELEKAEQEQRNNRPQQAQKHLNRAAEELGQPEQEKQQQQQVDSGEEKEQDEQQEAQPQPSEEKQPDNGNESTARQLLEMMQQEERELRDKLNEGTRARERRVEKDW